MTKQKLAWLEYIKAFALIWIFLNHVSEQLFGYPLIANPISGWPPLVNRIAQLAPLTGYGLWNILVNLLRYLGWIGDQGVQLFIIISGFGLTWGLLQRMTGKPLKLGKFYLRRGERIYPLWLGAHFIFIGMWLVTGWGLSLFDPATILSFIGIRITPNLLYYFSPAWWYFWLLLQLYLIYPLLWVWLQRFGPTKLLLYTSLISFVVRGAGLYLFEGYLDAWSRGAIFITRLPEFVFGISLAAWMFARPEETNKRLASTRTLFAAITVYIAGLLLSLTLPGMTIAPFLLGVGVFVILYQLFTRLPIATPKWLQFSGEWIGKHSYSLYLAHHPLILALIPSGFTASLGILIRVLLAILGTLFLALVLERSVTSLTKISQKLVKRVGVARTFMTVGLLVGVFIALLVGSELLVRRFAPQEVNGWGERTALEMDDELGWKLIPSKVTRLRWVSYDYKVESNSLGFPGPEYPPEKPEGIYRIMVTGDAFTSAEGVDTSQAWPRLLEVELKSKSDMDVQVMNFAITGYGPSQYASVIGKYAPLYKPDLIVVELFVNDFQDVLWSNEDFQNSIGFKFPSPNSISSIMELDHLRRFAEINVSGNIKELLRNEPNPHGYFLGNFRALEIRHPEIEVDGRQLTYEKLKDIQDVAIRTNSKVIFIFVPAPVQACMPDQLAYYPRNVDINNANRFDVDLPQTLMRGIAQALGTPLYDLRQFLSSTSICYYQSHNMHWTIAGHQAVANYMASVVIQDH